MEKSLQIFKVHFPAIQYLTRRAIVISYGVLSVADVLWELERSKTDLSDLNIVFR
jgi:hypothetical protein